MFNLFDLRDLKNQLMQINKSGVISHILHENYSPYLETIEDTLELLKKPNDLEDLVNEIKLSTVSNAQLIFHSCMENFYCLFKNTSFIASLGESEIAVLANIELIVNLSNTKLEKYQLPNELVIVYQNLEAILKSKPDATAIKSIQLLMVLVSLSKFIYEQKFEEVLINPLKQEISYVAPLTLASPLTTYSIFSGDGADLIQIEPLNVSEIKQDNDRKDLQRGIDLSFKTSYPSHHEEDDDLNLALELSMQNTSPEQISSKFNTLLSNCGIDFSLLGFNLSVENDKEEFLSTLAINLSLESGLEKEIIDLCEFIESLNSEELEILSEANTANKRQRLY